MLLYSPCSHLPMLTQSHTSFILSLQFDSSSPYISFITNGELFTIVTSDLCISSPHNVTLSLLFYISHFYVHLYYLSLSNMHRHTISLLFSIYVSHI